MYAPLTNANKQRHAQALQTAIFTKTLIKGRPGLPDVFPVVRVGSTRTADGAAFVMSDDKFVGKVIFYDDDETYQAALQEYEIGSAAGSIGVGPKYYAAYALTIDPKMIPANFLRNYEVKSTSAVLLLMENLGYKAQRLETVWDYAKRTGVYPIDDIEDLLEAMQDYRILHGDLHAGNILVRTEMNGSISLYVIDFGRSVRLQYHEKRLNFLVRGTEIPGHRGYFNINGKIVGSNANLVNRNYKRFMNNKKWGILSKAKTPTPPTPSNSYTPTPPNRAAAKTPTRLPKSFFRHTTGC